LPASPTDFNGDGRDDIVAFTNNSLGDTFVSTSTGSAFNGPGSAKWHEFFAPNGEAPLTGDFNGDGKDDVVVFTNDARGDVFVALSTGTGFGPAALWHGFFAPTGESPAVGDLNGDGKDDIITFAKGTSNDVFVSMSTGTGFAQAEKWHEFFGVTGEYPGVGDFNNDGKADIAIFTRGAAADVYVGLNTGTSFGAAQKWHDFFAPGVEQPRVGDVNGDKLDDIVVFTNNASGDVFVSLNTGGTGFGPAAKAHEFFAPNGEYPNVGDFNNDGKADLVTFTKGSTNDVWVALSNGTNFDGGGGQWHDFFGLNGEITL